LQTTSSNRLKSTGYQFGLSVDHALRAAGLPMHHRDPFDRMLIAQSLSETMAIATPDAVFDLYGVSLIW
jgi:PIN domain nuclease of toxin-antitoxin system